MALTIQTYPTSRALTTVAAVKALAVASGTLPAGLADTTLADIIDRASDAIVSFCSREFARALVLETVPGYGSIYLSLTQRPIVKVVTVSYQGTDYVTDYTIDDAAAGILYRAQEWRWTANIGYRLDRFVIPNSDRPDWWANYVGGWLMPGDNIVNSANVSAQAAGNCYYSQQNEFTALLQPGDRIKVSGFVTAANNGWSTVVSVTANNYIVVSGRTLVNEGPLSPDGVTIELRSLPKDIEQAAIETVLDWAVNGPRNRRVSNRKIGDLSLTYEMGQDDDSLLPSVQAKLAGYRSLITA